MYTQLRTYVYAYIPHFEQNVSYLTNQLTKCNLAFQWHEMDFRVEKWHKN